MDIQQPPRLNRSAWLTLGFVLFFIGLCAAQLIYRFFLPTDGWALISGPDNDLLYYLNLAGAPSGLQSLDQILKVEELPYEQITQPPSLWGAVTPPFWAVGNTVAYEVMRGDEVLTVSVSIVRWTPAVLVRYLWMIPSNSLSAIGTLLLFSVALIAFFRRPDEPAARALLIFAGVLTAMVITALIPDGLSTFL